jgi:hypothetical protein
VRAAENKKVLWDNINPPQDKRNKTMKDGITYAKESQANSSIQELLEVATKAEKKNDNEIADFIAVKARYLAYEGMKYDYAGLDYMIDVADTHTYSARGILSALKGGLFQQNAEILSLLDAIQECLHIYDSSMPECLWVHTSDFSTNFVEERYDQGIDDYVPLCNMLDFNTMDTNWKNTFLSGALTRSRIGRLLLDYYIEQDAKLRA